ncbi:unnamed protein product, partial [marine sediment metagenome]
DSYLNDVLMVGEFLGFGGVADFGGNCMDQLIDDSNADGYTTVGIPSDEFNIATLYDRDWPGNDWPKSEIIDIINKGTHIINHLGHGNNFHVMKLDEPVRMRQGEIYGECHDIVENLTNDRYFFVYSQACLSGAFDNKSSDLEIYPYDCIAEYLTTKTEHGAFAAIMNARYGFGSIESTDGPSHRFHREFLDAVFGENILQIGKANQDSKHDNLWRINQDASDICKVNINVCTSVIFPYSKNTRDSFSKIM